MGAVTAHTHFHGGGKFGAAVAQDLISFGRNLEWQHAVFLYLDRYARQVQLNYQDFCQATQDLY